MEDVWEIGTWMMFSRCVFCDCGRSISGHLHIGSLVERRNQITEVVSACVDRMAYVLLTSSVPKPQGVSLQSLEDSACVEKEVKLPR